jgi:general secretion pathway protein G
MTRSRRRGVTLLELMVALAVAALFASIAVPSYQRILQRQKVTTCTTDLQRLGLAIERYRLTHGDNLPATLDDLSDPARLDPWGNPYRYLDFAAPGAKNLIRKDHNLHPLNSAFDLYSVGPDGDSKAPLTAKASRDDIIWARDGAFVGEASEF